VLKRGLRKDTALVTNCQLQSADLEVCASKLLHGTTPRQKKGYQTTMMVLESGAIVVPELN
jgi:hypothetical protein